MRRFEVNGLRMRLFLTFHRITVEQRVMAQPINPGVLLGPTRAGFRVVVGLTAVRRADRGRAAAWRDRRRVAAAP